jgi:itaconate CoA-transferase
MSTPTELYKSKLTTADEAVALLPSTGNLAMPFFSGQPPRLLQALADRAKRGTLDAVRLYFAHASPAMAETLFHDNIVPDAIALHTMFPSYEDRKLFMAGRADGHKRLFFVPSSFSQMARVVSEYIKLDAALVQVSPMDRGGWMSTGTIGAFTLEAVQAARTVIVEVNPLMPRTHGSAIHIRDVHAVIEHTSELPEIPVRRPNALDEQMAQHIVHLVKDGSCLQFGVGGVPSAVGTLLADRNDLGIHSELLNDIMMDLIERGNVTNKYKVFETGRTVYTIALGTKRLYEAMHDNAGLVCTRAALVNLPTVIGTNPNVVSINSFIEVDLTGQVNAEAVSGHQYTAVGGQLDFVRGASLSQGGVSVLCAPSTAARGTASRIVPLLTGPSTDPRVDVHYIATEYGLADLRGKSTTERAIALINIAAPEFREELTHAAKKRNLL